MFLKKLFLKPNLIAFYKEEEIYRVLNEQYKKDKTIFSETKEFENKKDLKNYINSIIEENPQTYVSTITTTQNQGATPSCDKHYYKDAGIDTANIKFICINKKYSFYTTLYELMALKKEYPFIDYLYSPFALIDSKSSLRQNSLYVLATKENCFMLIYKDNIPVFADIFEFQEDSVNNDEEIEDISDMDIIEDFDENLDENIENVDEPEEEEEEESNMENFNIEYKILEHVKTTLKEYYNSDGDFIEKIIIFDAIGLEKAITKLIDEDIFIQSDIENIDILKTINNISRQNV